MTGEIIQFFDWGTGVCEVDIITREWYVITGGLPAYYQRVNDLQRAGWKAEHIGKVDPNQHQWKQYVSPPAPPAPLPK